MTQIKSGTDQSTVLKWWSRLARLPAGSWLFSLALGRIAPYSSTISARVEAIKPGYAQVSLKDRRRLRNHLHSLHAIALVNLGEIATGLAVLSTVSANMRGIVLDIQAEYVKKARGKVTAIAEFQLPESFTENTACQAEANLRDQTGETVAIVRASWLIGYKE